MPRRPEEPRSARDLRRAITEFDAGFARRGGPRRPRTTRRRANPPPVGARAGAPTGADAEVLYHGAKEEWEELEANDPGYGGSLGYGLYLTTDPQFAATFGRYIHEVVSPVPPDRVAQIEPDIYDCGNDMQLYTPGSAPFTFRIADPKTGEEHTYSVLGDCEEEVKRARRSELREAYMASARLKELVAGASEAVRDDLDALWRAATREADDVRSRVYGKDMADVVEEVFDNAADADARLTEEDLGTVRSILTRVAEELDASVGRRLSAQLGDEIDLDQLSSVCERHGYSAFFITGYAPGDEYVIFDDRYLPLKVRGVTKLPR